MTPLQLSRLQTIMAPAAVAIEKSTGIPAELMVAQCAEESGWLAFAPGNNAFGIKDYPGSTGRQLLDTKEWFTEAEISLFLRVSGRSAVLKQPVEQNANGRRLYNVKDWFATFPSLAACFAKYAEKFTEPRYSPVLAAYRSGRNLGALVTGIAGIYATSPIYAQSLLSIIRMPEVTAALVKARAALSTSNA